MSFVCWNIAEDGSASLESRPEHEVSNPAAIPLDPSGYVLYHKARAMGMTPVSIWPKDRGHELQQIHLSISSVTLRGTPHPKEIPTVARFGRGEEPYFPTGPATSIEFQCRHYKRGTLRDDVFGNYPVRADLIFDPEGGFAFTPEYDRGGDYIIRFLFTLRLSQERLNAHRDDQSAREIWDEVRMINLGNSVDFALLPHDEYAANYQRRVREFFIFHPAPPSGTAGDVRPAPEVDEGSEPASGVAGDAGSAARAMDLLLDMSNMDYNLSLLGDSERGTVTRWQYEIHKSELKALLLDASLSYEMTDDGYTKTWRFEDGTSLDGLMPREGAAVYRQRCGPERKIISETRF